VCRGPATIKIDRHNAAFCEPHYIEHIHRQIERVIDKYRMFGPDERVLLGVSGGKDSMGAWHALTELGYQVQAVHFNNGFGAFSEESEAVVRNFAEERGSSLRVYRFSDLMGFEFQEAVSRTTTPPCAVCGSFKRYHFNMLAGKLECRVVATGHNLDDETAFLMGNVLHWSTGYLRKTGPVLEPEPGMARKVKPLVRITDQEMLHYVRSCGVAVAESECPHAKKVTSHLYKRALDMLDQEMPGVKTEFYFGCLERMLPVAGPEWEKNRELGYCPVCGYRTMRSDMCSMCLLKSRVRGG
jgi:tRNA(Ile)-lysidine synthase TilS/MesJ